MEDMYTLERLKHAQEDLKRWEEKWANSDSNNPNKFRGNINEARSRVRLIKSVLKTNGTLPLTEQEQVNGSAGSKRPRPPAKSAPFPRGQCWGSHLGQITTSLAADQSVKHRCRMRRE
jgi:hypothetical protein